MVAGGSSYAQILISDANKSSALLEPGQTLEPTPEKNTVFESAPLGS